MGTKRRTRKFINIWELTQCYVHDFAQALGSETHDLLSGWIRNRAVEKLATCSSLGQLSFASDPSRTRVLLQVEAFFKKNSSIKVDHIDPQQAAEASFYSAEAKCKRTNDRLTHYCLFHPDRLSPEMARMIMRAQHYIEEVLGPFQLFLDELPKYLRFSSGATALSKRDYSMAGRRLKRSASTTRSCVPYADALWTYSKLPGGFRGRLVESNRIIFVYKNFKTKRTIACEPEANSAFQLAFDTYAKRRLARKGQDLRRQERNQHQAYLGSIDGTISTEDFKQASDTVAKVAVSLLFDPDWYAYLNRIRCKQGYLAAQDVTVNYEKFSSMGNGSTFTIETLIFAACAHAVGSRGFQVYGDDVTIETEFSEPFRALTRFLGFTINVEKSYNSGYYRESCGKHYVRGEDVTPFFVRSLKWHSPNLCHLMNGLMCRISVANSRVFHYCKSLLHELRKDDVRLPIVAQVEDSCKGLHVSAPFAEELGHLRYVNCIPVIRGNTPKSERSRPYHNHGSFWLWLIEKEYRHLDDSPAVGLDEYTRATGRYKVCESVWRKPDGMLPPVMAMEFLLTSAMTC